VLAFEKVGFLFLTFFIGWAGALDAVLLVLPHLPYPLPKREVKEEYETPAPQRTRGSGIAISIYEPTPRASRGSAVLVIPKPDVKEEEDGLALLLSHQRRVASSDDPDDTPEFNA
jgi:hypothetical protein